MRTLQSHAGISAVALSPDGKTLASGGGDRPIKLWDVASGEELRTLKGYAEWVNSIAFSPDGKTLASGSEDGHYQAMGSCQWQGTAYALRAFLFVNSLAFNNLVQINGKEAW